jgi:hypothetical protein
MAIVRTALDLPSEQDAGDGEQASGNHEACDSNLLLVRTIGDAAADEEEDRNDLEIFWHVCLSS